MIIRFSLSAALLVTFWPATVSAQSLGEILGDTTRFIGRQLNDLSREIDQLTSPPPPPRRRARPPNRNRAPSRARNANVTGDTVTPYRIPPLPQRTPRRYLRGEQRSLKAEEAAAALRAIAADDPDFQASPTSDPETKVSAAPTDAAKPDEATAPGNTPITAIPKNTDPKTAEMTEAEQLRAEKYRWPRTLRIPRAKPRRKQLAARSQTPVPAPSEPSRAAPLSPQKLPATADTEPAKPKAVHPRDEKVADWTAAEIAAAKRQCTKQLARLALVYEKLDPIREGRCGTPAPIMVARVGSPESVRISPPATVSCDMAAALSQWFEKVVQPAALIHLGGPITKVRNVSSYVCRHRSRDPDKPLSEHSSANALDIAEFETAAGKRIALTKHWPPTTVATAEVKKPEVKKTKPTPSGGGSVPSTEDPVRTAEAPQATAAKVDTSTAQPDTENENPFTGTTGMIAPPPEKPAAGKTKPKSPEELFLREVHAKGCEIFGTALGPDANADHRDHFHFDMAKRRSGYCR